MKHTDQQRAIHLNLRKRQNQLEAIAKGNRRTYSLGKGVGLGGGGGAAFLLMVGNPAMAGAIAGLALLNYLLAAMAEASKTGEWRPLLGAKSLTTLASGLDKNSDRITPTMTIEDDALYLDDTQLGEWILLRTAMPQCIQFLELYPDEHKAEVFDLAAIEAYRQYGYMFRGEPDTRLLMKSEAVGQYAFAAVRQQADFLLSESDDQTEEPATEKPAPKTNGVPVIGANTKLNAIATPTVPINPSPAIPTTAPITVADAPKSVEELAKEFPAWFKDWCADLLQKTESYTRLPFAPLQKIWLKDHPGNTAQEFSAVLQRHLPPGGTIKPDGGITYIYLTEGKAEEFKGTQVAPKVPGELSVRDRVIVYLQPVGMINVEELLQAFPSEREDVKTALRQLAKEKKLKVNQSTRTVCLNA